MDKDLIELISNSINQKKLLELQSSDDDDLFLFAPYILYTIRSTYGLFGTERVYHPSGKLEVDVRDLAIEGFNTINETDDIYDKSFFMEKFQLLGDDELKVVCANEDFKNEY